MNDSELYYRVKASEARAMAREIQSEERRAAALAEAAEWDRKADLAADDYRGFGEPGLA